MSMISAQIDELRQMADGHATYRDARAVMLQAADTITELRGALQVASVDYRHLQAENDRLRQQLADVTESMGRVEERCAKLREYIERKQHLQDFARLVSENSKLREQVDYMTPLALYEASEQERDRMRELGVEVDG